MRNSLKLRWAWALGWLLSIYASLPFVRPIATFLRERNLLRLTLGFIFLIIVFIAFRWLYQRYRSIDVLSVLCIIMILLAYGISIVSIPLPEERFHFIQYGVLVFLVFQALRLSVNPPLVYLLAFLLTSLAGWGDEGIQYLLPDRYYELKDVGLNCLSALLGLGVTYVGERIKKCGIWNSDHNAW